MRVILSIKWLLSECERSEAFEAAVLRPPPLTSQYCDTMLLTTSGSHRSRDHFAPWLSVCPFISVRLSDWIVL